MGEIRTLISREEIDTKLADMGRQITADYEGEDLLIVGVLKGAFMVMADLARHIDLPIEFDFMAVSSYGASTQTSGVVRILKDLDHEIGVLRGPEVDWQAIDVGGGQFISLGSTADSTNWASPSTR